MSKICTSEFSEEKCSKLSRLDELSWHWLGCQYELCHSVSYQGLSLAALSTVSYQGLSLAALSTVSYQGLSSATLSTVSYQGLSLVALSVYNHLQYIPQTMLPAVSAQVHTMCELLRKVENNLSSGLENLLSSLVLIISFNGFQFLFFY